MIIGSDNDLFDSNDSLSKSLVLSWIKYLEDKSYDILSKHYPKDEAQVEVTNGSQNFIGKIVRYPKSLGESTGCLFVIDREYGGGSWVPYLCITEING